ncbi:MAG: methyltransferase family protein [Candidatus Bathyarchaeia archaeon]
MPENHKLVTWGPCRYVRHPSYLAYLILFIGLSLTLLNIVALIPLIAIPGYIQIASIEEELLIKRFGKEYQQYQQTTGKFLPKRKCQAAAGLVKSEILVPRLTSHGALTPELKFTAPRMERTQKAVSSLVEAVMAAREAEEREASELAKAKERIRELEKTLAEAQREIERLKTALAVKETIKVEVKPALEVKPAQLLPSVLESLDQDAKQVWCLLKQKPGKYKAELMAAFGWGRRRLDRAVRVLRNRRLIYVRGRKLYASEPLC